MEIMEIINDALVYPFSNIKALIIYMILGIIAGIAAGGTVFALLAGANLNNAFSGAAGVIGLLVTVIILLLLAGYELDIVKFAINRDPGAPGIDIARQIANAIKLIIVDFVYYIVPALIIFVIGLFLKDWILNIIALILLIIFSLANFMARCRLAKTDDLGDAIAIGEAIGDISRVGILNLVIVAALVLIILFVIAFIIAFISKWNSTVGGILMGIFFVYAVFFSNRAIGLLYSGV